MNLRLNRLMDDGGRMLLEGLCDTCKIIHLNLSGNLLARQTTIMLMHILAEGNLLLESLDLSCNELTNRDLHDIAKAMEENEVIHQYYQPLICFLVLGFDKHGFAIEQSNWRICCIWYHTADPSAKWIESTIWWLSSSPALTYLGAVVSDVSTCISAWTD